jgi:hypothetical protein
VGCSQTGFAVVYKVLVHLCMLHCNGRSLQDLTVGLLLDQQSVFLVVNICLASFNPEPSAAVRKG